jgi:hypothetical protein
VKPIPSAGYKFFQAFKELGLSNNTWIWLLLDPYIILLLTLNWMVCIFFIYRTDIIIYSKIEKNIFIFFRKEKQKPQTPFF